MTPLDNLYALASRKARRIVLSEGTDTRVVTAAVEAEARTLAKTILIGAKDEIIAKLNDMNVAQSHRPQIHDPQTDPLAGELAALYLDLRKHKGMTEDAARQAVTNPHVFAALMVRSGHADGTVGGAVATTPEIVRTAIQVIGPKPGLRLVSSFFLMIFNDASGAPAAHVFTDCGLVVDPTADELAQIAATAAQSFAVLTAQTPRVAMLSFSSMASAAHPMVDKVATATRLAQEAHPELAIDGELQFDAAFVPEIAAKKAPRSAVAGQANVFVFPNLDAGNIGYKIAQRVGGAVAVGPILQGLNQPANDLSRGCSADDIVKTIAITAAQVAD
jgi:phosphate acetyltransferase